MPNDAQQIVSKLWNYCQVLRDDGLSYGDYLEQLTVLLFLKMAHEQTQPPWNRPSPLPKDCDWPSLLKRDGDELETHYRHVLERLGKQPGMLGIIFRKAQNKIQDPAKLRRLVADLIGGEQWSTLDADVKGEAYEGLLERNAQDTKSGAGQYFTPRALIRAIVEVMQPRPGDTICDPACGTGGFLLAAHDRVAKHHPHLDPDQRSTCARTRCKATWSEEQPAGRWRAYGIDELLARDKASLDLFWLKDESLEDSANLPAPEVIAAEIAEDLRAALEQFEAIQADLSSRR